MTTKIAMSPNIRQYYKQIQKGVENCYEVASEARAKGLDPELTPEIPQASDVASRVEELIGPSGIGNRIRFGKACEHTVQKTN